MAGPGIRYRHFALQLAETHDVSLMIPNETSERLDGVNVLHAREFGYRRFTRLVGRVDVVVIRSETQCRCDGAVGEGRHAHDP